MDEILDVLDVLADSGFEGVLTWLFRVLGVLAVLAGLGVWLLTDITVLVPIALAVIGVLLLIVPGLLLELTELAG